MKSLVEEFKESNNQINSELTKYSESSTDSQLTIMSAIADLYDQIAELQSKVEALKINSGGTSNG